jgi:post-segregation antitoxin (ccd killing protein)
MNERITVELDAEVLAAARDAYNRMVEKHGLFSDGYRTF